MRISKLLAFVCLTLAATASLAQGWGRAGTWEAGFNVTDTSSERLEGAEGSGLAVRGETGFGFTGGYNFTDRFAVLGEMNWSSPSYDATFVPEGGGAPETISATMDVVSLHAKGVFYLLPGDFTPYIEAGVGWTEIDSNVLDSPPITGCWWDPWWGYVCSTFFSTYSTTQTSYTTAVGLRWDMNSDMVLRASYGLNEIESGRGTEDFEMDTVQIGFSWRF
jgi:opacity protein-like surface antigen